MPPPSQPNPAPPPTFEHADPATVDGAEDRSVHGVVRGHVVTAVQTLRKRMDEKWTLDTLAEEIHLSRSQLVRAFDAHYGISPTEFRR
jgi:transcriptional regulator GlxA family with amidase domain